MGSVALSNVKMKIRSGKGASLLSMKSLRGLLAHGILISLALMWIYPFVWMITASFKSQKEFFGSKLKLLPAAPTFENILRVWNMDNFSIYFLNTVIVTVSVVFIVLAITAMAGYVFGRYNFIGRKIILLIFISSITIPMISTMIPVYEIVRKMGLIGTRTGLILASAGGAHVIFLLLFMSYFRQLPKALEEAAMMDGCNFWQVFRHAMFPLAKPIATTVIIMESVWTWNDFLRPLVLTLNNPSARTLAVGLYAFKGENIIDWTGIAAGGTIAIVPVIILFISLQKYFVDGVAGAVKS